MQQKTVAAWKDYKTAVAATNTTPPRINLDQIADEIVANVQKRKHTRYLNPWERVALYNSAFPKYPRMDWDKGHIKGNWLLGNFYGRDNDYYGGYPATAFTRLHTIFKPDCDVFFHLFAGTMVPIPPNTITLDIKPEITIRRKTKKLLRKDDKGHRRTEVIRPTICVKPDTLLLGDNIQIGMAGPENSTFGFTGLNKIQQKFEREYDGEMIHIRAQCLLPIEITPEHPMLTARSITKSIHGPHITGFTGLAWKKAGELEPKKKNEDGDYLVIPRLKGIYSKTNFDGLEITESLAYLIGAYIAEGSVGIIWKEHYSTLLDYNPKEIELRRKVIEKAAASGYHTGSRKVKSGTQRLEISNKKLTLWLSKWCGHKATEKRIPDFLLLHKDERILRAVLEGYLDGDGNETRYANRPTTVSKILALQLQMVSVRLGYSAGITLDKKAAKKMIRGQMVNCKDKYIVQIFDKAVRWTKLRFFDEYVLTPVRRVERVHYNGPVNNVETADNTYLVCNATVHNCDDVRNLGYNVKIWRNENTPPKIGDHGSYILRQGRTKVNGKRKYRYWWIVRKYSAAYRKIFSVVDVVYADPPYAGKHDKFGTTPFDKRQVIRDLGVLLPSGAFLCWFDTLYPMFRKDHYRLIGTIEVRIGTNTSIRGWTLWQRR